MSEAIPFLKAGPHFINLAQITRVLLTAEQASIWLSGEGDKLTLNLQDDGVMELVAALASHSRRNAEGLQGS